MDVLKRKISQARAAVVDVRNGAMAKKSMPDDIKVDLATIQELEIPLTEGISQVFNHIKNIVDHEKNAFTKVQQTQGVSSLGFSLEENASPYVNAFAELMQVSSIYDYPEDKVSDFPEEEEYTESEMNLIRILTNELDYASEFMAELGYSITILNKIKTALEALKYKRLNDALNVVRNAKKNAPNNRSLAFVLSQMYYYKASNGGGEYLPEARGEAKKAALYSDDVDPVRLRFYRYAYTVCEAVHDKEKTAALMREFYLLNPESLVEGDGLFVHESTHLKTWALLSQFGPDAIGKYEIESLQTIVKTAPTGLNFYMSLMRGNVLKRIGSEKDVLIQKMLPIEELIVRSYQNYQKTVTTLQQYYSEEGKVKPEPKYTWTIEYKYVSNFLRAAPIPNFDEVYLYSSLDAKRHSTEAYPNRAMPAMGLPNINYWQVWSLAISGVEGKASSKVLPIDLVADQAALFRKFDSILEGFAAYENEIVPPEKWQIIEKYMPNYEYQIFIHVAAGAGAFAVPTNPYYLNLYKSWVKERPVDPLPSEIIREYAEKGHFIDTEEAICALEGALRVMEDEVHGLKARAREALKECLKQEKGNKANRAKDLLREGHFNDYWWLYVIVAPLAVMAFFIMSGSGGSSTGFGLIMFIIVFAVVLGWGMYALSKGESDETEDADADAENADGSVAPDMSDIADEHKPHD